MKMGRNHTQLGQPNLKSPTQFRPSNICSLLFTPFLNEIYAYIVVNYSYYYCYFLYCMFMRRRMRKTTTATNNNNNKYMIYRYKAKEQKKI